MDLKSHLIRIVAIVLLTSGTVFSQSFYSINGFGVTNYFVNAKSVGMGGAGIAVYEDLTQAFLNPAGLSALTSTYVSGSIVHEVSSLGSSTQDATITNTDFQGVQFSFPFKARSAALSLGAMPYSFVGYSAVGRGEKDNKTFDEEVAGSGGLNSAFASFAIAPVKRLTLGVTALYYFGQIRSRWEVDFDDGAFIDTRDETSFGVTGGDYRLGVIIRPVARFVLGAIYSPSQSLNAKKRIVVQNSFEWNDFPQEKVDIPEVIGFGASVYPIRKIQLLADYYSERWSKANISESGYVNDSKRFSAGFEFLPARFTRQQFGLGYWSRVAYRFGFYHRDLGLEVPVGQSVKETFVTIGLGLPVKWNLARFDMSLEFGKRGSKTSNPFEESVVRFTGSITVGERWFQRRRR